MRIFKWSPTFTPGQESSVVPVWACLPELPAHLFHKNALFTIASMIGTPLQIDDFTFNQSKLSKARICVEIDVTHSLLEEFDILIHGTTITQKVEYEQVPHYCRLCKHVGHQDTECYSKGNATKPRRRFPDAKQYHKQGKNVVEFQARQVLDRMPEANLTRTEVGVFAVDRQRYVPEAVVINAHKEIGELPQLIHSDEIEIIHAENDVLAVENDVLTAENEDSASENEFIRVVENNAIHEGHTNDNGDISVHCVNGVTNAENGITHAENNISNAENEVVITCGKGDENGLHVVDDASFRVGNDDINAILCVENAKVIEETEIVERKETEILGKEAEIVEKTVGIITTRPNIIFGDLWRGKRWISADNAFRLIQNLKRFGVAIKGIKEDVEAVIKRNKLAVSSAIQFQKCVLLYDPVRQLNLKPLDTGEQFDQGVPSPEKPSPIASRTRCCKKGKKALAVHRKERKIGKKR
ncbi:UNVERIFIED_CONTAM: hypothetical protein Sradi_6502100 [Sesamum radiatum]|uniref:DUF4283 domain-containing protein n=1 Tax=Sesamum radiatum TaxID=300843 RepID=A0AAW2JWI7_SESRA